MFGVLALVAAVAWFVFVREAPRPNVILISIDTLRPDHLGCYDYPKDTSPNIDRLAKRGVRFDRAHSSTTWTLPAHLSMMTGLPDALHGVRHDLLMLDGNRRMLAERFQRAGYDTAGFFGGPYLSPEFGFQRGFRVYQNCGVPTRKEIAASARTNDELNRAVALMEQQSHRVQTAERTQNEVDKYLDGVGDEPFFLFIHHWDTHYDFTAPKAYVDMFAPDYRGDLDLSNFMMNEAIAADMSPADYQYMLAAYDAEIRWVDYHVGRLLQKLDDLELTDDTYVVITSDHGEEFFEHGNKGHRYNLHEESLRIPLIIAGPDVGRGLQVDRQARIFDIMPTLLELAGLAPESESFGASLVPFLEGDDPERLRSLPLIAELTYIPKILDPDEPQGWREPDHYFHHQAFGRGGKKLIDVRRRRFDHEQPASLAKEVLEQYPPPALRHRQGSPRERQPRRR